MGLRLTLKPNERVIVNGCILKNGPRRQMLEVENRADILRGDDMLSAETAQTPARRVAYQLQIALVSPQHRDVYLPQIYSGLDALAEALPRFATTLAEVDALARAGNFYLAFKALMAVVAHEDLLFSRIEKVAT